ncbi:MULTISPECIES: GNAT family N-acetyltransferase [Spirulina sp. CCY15215]|uniref:GNAT family N-acetyltransferase n=1 Tax=Spirulina sp. CCY15215 TaxID=2767591 RepID=UPI0019507000|nr:GNAT family N-acetyltransferase [Spirulina major]
MQNTTYSLNIRSAKPEDVPTIFSLIKALAEYERLSHEVTGGTAELHKHLFGDRPYIEAILAEWEGEIVGFALFFCNYSTFLTQPGLYLEDLFVLPDYRRRGIGKKMFQYLAQLAIDRQYGRFEWSVLDWNESAIAFYKSMGAVILDDWRICRLTGDNLQTLTRI